MILGHRWVSTSTWGEGGGLFLSLVRPARGRGRQQVGGGWWGVPREWLGVGV